MQVWNEMRRREAMEDVFDQARARMSYETMMFNRAAQISAGAAALAAYRARRTV
jgi:hypothetical protein